MLNALPLSPAASLTLDRHSWLYAQTFVSRGDPALMVYRSAAVRSTDPVYLPVAAFLAELEEIAVVHEEIRDDDDMMLGRGIFTIYAYSTGVVIEPTYRLGRPVHPLFTTEELDKHLSLKGTNV